MFLVAGLVGGLFLQDLALALRPFLPEMVALLLFFSAARIGPRQAAGSLMEARATLGIVVAFQLVLPLVLTAALFGLGLTDNLFATALILTMAGSSISGAPHFSVMVGAEPAPALRILVLGTALLPLTVIPVFWLMPGLGDAATVAWSALKLTFVIGVAVGVAFLWRGLILTQPSDDQIAMLDGASVLLLAIIVVGLMSAVGPAISDDPGRFAPWLGFACLVNFGPQVMLFLLAGRRRKAIPPSIISGNRNIALFLAALPAEVTTPLLLYIGCYQIPMYLTPIVMRPLYLKIRR